MTATWLLLQEILADFKHLDLTGCVEFDHPTVPVAQGGFGDVYKGRYKRLDGSETPVAIKCLTVYLDGSQDAMKIFSREIKAWSILKHQNVLPLLGYIFEVRECGTLSVPSLVSEWMANGALVDFMKTQAFEYDYGVPKLLLNMAEGLEHLHKNNIVHSDFKSTNVLVSGDGKAVISDFGSAHICSGDDSGSASSNVSGLRGTSRWLAYELLVPNGRDPKPTKASDVWAFGMTLYELITNRHPYADHLIDAQVLIAIMNRKLPTCPSTLSPREKQLWTICVSCWKCEPVERPSMTSICKTIKQVSDHLGPRTAVFVPQLQKAQLQSGPCSSPSHLDLAMPRPHTATIDIHISCGLSCDHNVGNHREVPVLVGASRASEKLEYKEIKNPLAIPPHPNVQTLPGYTSYLSRSSSALVYDDDIMSFLKKHPDSNVLALAIGIAEGLAHIHNHDVVHGNIRASNVIVRSDGQPFISGFTCARKLPCDGSQREVQGSLRWMAPELMNTENKNSEIVTKERDVWAFGMTVYELLSGDIPYAEEKYDALLVLDIAEGRLPMCPSTSGSWTLVRQGLWSICLACWNAHRESRPPMRKVIGALKGLSILQSVMV